MISHNYSLKKHNTFGVDCSTLLYAEASSYADLKDIFSQYSNQPLLVVGSGSNILFTKDFEGLVLKMANKEIELLKRENDKVYVKAGAGVVWHDFVQYCVDNGFGGVENLALIPGTVGASPIQNIGAYGVEAKDTIFSCEVFDLHTQTLENISVQDCHFAYRDSIFKSTHKGRYVVLSVTYCLSLKHTLKLDYGAIKEELSNRNIANPTIKDVAEVVAHIRVNKLPDPSTIGNAGSFFKNPVVPVDKLEQVKQKYPDVVSFPFGEGEVKIAAGWMIEKCGWKGKFVGNVGTWKNQALVIVSNGNASGKEIFDYSTQIIQDVAQKFGIDIEREVNIV